MRLNKYLAACGVASRRKAEELISQGRVKVNDKVVKVQGIILDLEKDVVSVDNKKCSLKENHIYLALNKPVNYVCTSAHFAKEKSIFDLLPKKYQNLKIAGRLDKNSQGLVLLSNDGDFIYTLTHPKYRHEKEYEVFLDKELNSRDLSLFKKGIKLEEGIALFDKIKFINNKKYSVILHQGWKRQIRRMFESLDYKVIKLTRIREGKFKLGNLKTGEYREIKKNDII